VAFLLKGHIFMPKVPEPSTFGPIGDVLTWLWVIGISLLGGVVSFMRKVKAGHARAWNFAEFIGEIVTSAFVGIITYNLCAWQNFPTGLTVSLVAISSHMGTRALFRLESVFDSKFPPARRIDDEVPK
jgi:hypothetical protein